MSGYWQFRIRYPLLAQHLEAFFRSGFNACLKLLGGESVSFKSKSVRLFFGRVISDCAKGL
jgi:hypothetical protein